MEEIYLFGDGREALKVPVVSWNSTSGLVILHKPGVGPQDFQGHVINVVTITVREFCAAEKVIGLPNTHKPF